MKIAFDIDDTLFKLVKDEDQNRLAGVGAQCACGEPLKQVPDDMLVAFVHQLLLDPENQVFLWSAGGRAHCEGFIARFAPAWRGIVGILDKEQNQDIDICFDDQDVSLAKVNLRVKREHANHWEKEELS